MAVTFTNAKAEDYKIEYSTDNKTWSEKAPGVSEIGSKVTIYVRATPSPARARRSPAAAWSRSSPTPR